MRNLILLSLLAGPLACGHANDNSKASSHDAPAQGLYFFSVDRRPFDGNLDQIQIKRGPSGDYTALHRVVTAGFGSPASSTIRELGSGMACTETREGRVVLELQCSVDLRPADGALVELSFVRDEEGTYSASLHRATYATLQWPAVDETIEVATGLQRLR